MLADFITNLRREVTYNYKENFEDKEIVFIVKGLSIKNLALIMNHKDHGALLINFVNGLSIESDNKDEIRNAVSELIDTNYANLVYHFVAACVYVVNEKDEEICCIHDYLKMNDLPLDLMLELLNNALELSLPSREFEVKKNIKKLMKLLSSAE